MRLHNIQEHLAKTQILQRLQSIQQDALRADQAQQTPDNEQRSVQAREQVRETQQTEQDQVREREARRRGRRRKRKRKKGEAEVQEKAKGEVARKGKRRRPGPDGGGAVIDVRV
jgi:hypothetical protein